MLDSATHKTDPLDSVMAEDGPYHVRDDGPAYSERLKATGRAEIADRFATRSQPFRNDCATTGLPSSRYREILDR